MELFGHAPVLNLYCEALSLDQGSLEYVCVYNREVSTQLKTLWQETNQSPAVINLINVVLADMEEHLSHP